MEIYNYTVNVVSLSSNVHNYIYYGVKNYNINIETRVKIQYHAHIHECLHKYVVYVKMPTRALL